MSRQVRRGGARSLDVGLTERLPTPRPAPSLPPVEVLDTWTLGAGASLLRVRVEDLSTRAPGAERDRVQAEVASLDALLEANPEWAAPTVRDGDLVPGNDVARWFYRTPVMAEWRTALVPTAQALFPMQRPAALHLPTGTPVDDVMRGYFTHGVDAIGIRTRAALMGHVVRGVTAALLGAGQKTASWVSLACGAAVPMLDAVAALDADRVQLTLVDLDPAALDFARVLAQAEGLREGEHFSILQRDLVRTIVARDSLVDELGPGSAAVVEGLGIFEYFTDRTCTRMLRNAYRLLQPGGVLAVGNMLSDRPQLAFNQRGVGWPRIRPRSIDELLGLVSAAGLPLERTTISIPEDGVYAVLHVTR